MLNYLVVLQPLTDIYVAFGMGKRFRFYHINHICKSLGEPKSRGLLMFHAYSGCDTTSAFNGKGKKSAWKAWKAYDLVTDLVRTVDTDVIVILAGLLMLLLQKHLCTWQSIHSRN